MTRRTRLPERCGKVARHTSRKVTQANPASSAVVPRMSPSCCTIAQEAQIGLEFGSIRPNIGQNRSYSAKHGQTWRSLAEVGRVRADSGQIWADVDHVSSILANMWPCLANPGPMLTEVGQNLTMCRKCWPNIGQILPKVNSAPGAIVRKLWDDL